MTLSNSNIRQAAAHSIKLLETIVYPSLPDLTPLLTTLPSPPTTGFSIPMNMDWDIMLTIGAQVKQLREDATRKYHVERYEEHCFLRRNMKGRLVKSWADNQLRTVVKVRGGRGSGPGRATGCWLCLPSDRVCQRGLGWWEL